MKKLIFIPIILLSITCLAQNANQQTKECVLLKRKVDSLQLVVTKLQEFAKIQKLMADSAKMIAIKNAAEASLQKQIAEKTRHIAEQQKIIATKNRQEAIKQKIIADSLTLIIKKIK